MVIDKIRFLVDGLEHSKIEFRKELSGLSAGAHTISVGAYNGATLVNSSTRNFMVSETSYDPDYQAVLDVATANSIPHPTAAQKNIDNQKMIGIKAAGLLAKADVILNFESTADISFRLICWKRKILSISYGSPIWSNLGWKGNGTNAYIDPLYNTADTGVLWTTNSAGVLWKSFDLGTTTLGAITGGYDGSTTNYTLLVPNGGNSTYYSMQDNSNKTTASYGRIGLNAVNRISSAQIQIHDNSPISRNVGVKWAHKLFIGGRNRVDQSGTMDVPTSEGIGFIAMGASMAAEYTSLKTILE